MHRMDVEILGEGADLVLLHSLLTDRSSFAGMAKRLSGQRRLILVNLPGFGRSAPAEPLDGYLERIVEMLHDLEVPPNADILGNGLGGFVALKLVARDPSMVGRMVLLGAAITFPEVGRQTFRALAEKVERDGMDAITDAAMARMFPAEFIAAAPLVIAERRAVFRGIDANIFAAAARALAALDLTPELDRIRNPVMVVAGEMDGATPPVLGREIAGRLPDARMIELAGVGHAPHIQAPDELIEAISPFLGLR
jgi:3-oxoadipate enol-lactonase